MSEDITVVTGRLLDVYAMSLEELNDFIAAGNFVISKAVDYEQITLSDLPGDWKLIHSKPMVGSKDVILFIVPTSPNTQRIWDNGQFRIAREAGLSSRQSRRWVKANLKFKYDLLPAIADILKEDNLVRAFVNYSSTLSGETYISWIHKYNFTAYVDRPWYRTNKTQIRTLLERVLADAYIREMMETDEVEQVE